MRSASLLAVFALLAVGLGAAGADAELKDFSPVERESFPVNRRLQGLLLPIIAEKKKFVIPKFPLVKKQFPIVKKAQTPPAVAGTTPAVSGAPVVTTGVAVGRRLLQD
ncbi:hypothetical protein COCSUDRAFT_57919 [Coccomyxa subellipsoidea C-169]|uniref:Uncharacterized protein n=1 Tax=Coccomyxa subellipsoidea (strain C-169) TaxID=574566 RepID=I0YP78_COCSC|nr:hypothetical protein COCSUDRAFT_57919 [Coccomyxa subellipsoidea C-169]EIE20197.1 hypothetical protein COCSUDRAFT_57919 [Coccomyxa subellipsoidea C-169]|eukprot:XP_005644741.1 hypothetical protein COCSUDRAFT_57919 [Coccomyxa subellipsoidea C-169]